MGKAKNEIPQMKENQNIVNIVKSNAQLPLSAEEEEKSYQTLIN